MPRHWPDPPGWDPTPACDRRRSSLSSDGCESPPRFPGRSRVAGKPWEDPDLGRCEGRVADDDDVRCGDRRHVGRYVGSFVALQVTFAGLAVVAHAAPRLPGRSGTWLGLLAVVVYRRWVTRFTPACPDTAESCSEHARRVFRDLPAHEALTAIRARRCHAHGDTR